MSNGDAKICDQVRGYLNNSGVLDEELEIQHATKFAAKSGANRAALLVFNSGRIHLEGAESDLKKWLGEVKQSIEAGTGAPGILLPAEIEKFPQTLRERVPACDDVVLWFYQEALRCYEAGSPAGAAFMLGAASEKVIQILIDTYASRIELPENREKFQSRVNNRMISVKYDEFKRSYKHATPRPTEQVLAQDLEQMLEGAFNFFRSTRNQVGHPQVIPDLDTGVILANIGQFIVYTEHIYALIAFYVATTVKVYRMKNSCGAKPPHHAGLNEAGWGHVGV